MMMNFINFNLRSGCKNVGTGMSLIKMETNKTNYGYRREFVKPDKIFSRDPFIFVRKWHKLRQQHTNIKKESK